MAAADFVAQSEAIVFPSYFADLPDRQQRGKVVYPLQQIPLLCLLAVLAGAETFVDIARFGRKKIEGMATKTPHRRHGGGWLRAMWTRNTGDRIYRLHHAEVMRRAG